MAFGNEVEVRIKTTDRYGRIVDEVILLHGSTLDKELVFVGLAWWYRRYAPNDCTLKALEAGARAAKRGLWADSNPIPPWEWRRGGRGYRATKKEVSALYHGNVNPTSFTGRDVAITIAGIA